MSPNADLVAKMIQSLLGLNVHEVIVCAGARNVPIVEGLEKFGKFKVLSFFEERSAAFYALGRIRYSERPVAVVTTSGTAVAELLPAVIESYYQELPLVLITADRPKSYRGSGAPQAIEQSEIFGSFVEKNYDWDHKTKNFKIQFSGYKPIHFNLCFDEPLLDGSVPVNKMTRHLGVKRLKVKKKGFQSWKALKFKKIQRPLVIVSELPFETQKNIRQFLTHSRLDFVSESLSGLISDYRLAKQDVSKVFQNLSSARAIDFFLSRYDAVIRIGGVPTIRIWRDLEFTLSHVPVFSFSHRRFSGLSRKSDVFDILDLSKIEHSFRSSVPNSNFEIDKVISDIAKDFPQAEGSLVHSLALTIKNDPLYLGNSLPIREWDRYSVHFQNAQFVYGNRGANGIDGQVSTYLGWSKDFDISWCVIGDLTAMYDLAALSMVDATEKKMNRRIVIINNSGGQIFSQIFSHKKYLNEHQIGFSNWAEMFGWDYVCVKQTGELTKLNSISSRNCLIEVIPDQNESTQFLNAIDSAVKQKVDRAVRK